ncbi:MAG TPA: hypothetical protein VGL22_10275 [Terracidiphilus sp.]|jgi:hypothetical protein
MSDRQNQPQQKQSEKEVPDTASASQSAGSAVRHVGKTLESDPEYNDRPSRELAPEIGLIDPHGNDITASPNMYAGSDPLVGTELSETGSGLRVEPLKTRLPGDTSSDPHTDLGPDNATNLQHRGE